MRNELITINNIRWLAEYFRRNFIDPNLEEDKNLNHLEYAIEAMESLVNNVGDTRRANNDFEFLTGQVNYDSFATVLEEEDYIDAIVDIFEKR